MATFSWPGTCISGQTVADREVCWGWLTDAVSACSNATDDRGCFTGRVSMARCSVVQTHTQCERSPLRIANALAAKRHLEFADRFDEPWLFCRECDTSVACGSARFVQSVERVAISQTASKDGSWGDTTNAVDDLISITMIFSACLRSRK